MSLPAWTGYALVGVAVAIAAAVFLSEWLQARAANRLWEPLPGGGWYLPAQVDAGRLARAFSLAESCIVTHGPWAEADVQRAVSGWRIFVRPSDAWVDAGIQVSGLTHVEVGMLEVGADLAALCHELIHAAEHVLERRTDEAHGSWPRRGLSAAQAAYAERWQA